MQHQEPDWAHQRVQSHLLESARIIQQVVEHCMEDILAAANVLATSFQAGGKLLLCGNGGSAADCQHLAAEFTNRLTSEFERPGLPALALTTDTSFLTAYTNDYSFEGVFARQVQTFGKPDDVLLGISTSGSSQNVVRAIKLARTMEIQTIALTGSLGHLKEIAATAICVPSSNSQHIQEAHLIIEHILCDLVESILFRHSDDDPESPGSSDINP